MVLTCNLNAIRPLFVPFAKTSRTDSHLDFLVTFSDFTLLLQFQVKDTKNSFKINKSNQDHTCISKSKLRNDAIGNTYDMVKKKIK